MNEIENLTQQFDFYLENKSTFINEYNEKYIVIKDKNVLLAANSRKEAIDLAVQKGLELGSFLVQHVSKDNDETMQRYHSRVYC